jgi:hypothetical protein
MLMQAYTPAQLAGLADPDRGGHAAWERIAAGVNRAARWVWVMQLFILHSPPAADQAHLQFVGVVGAGVDRDGVIMPLHDQPGEMLFVGDPEEVAGAIALCQIFSLPVLLALSFLHCKNVTITEPARDQRHDRAARRRGDPEGLTYHRLVIEPMQKSLRQAADEAGAPGDLRVALHIMRGHFKHYEQGRGLFGKLHGRYWWPSQVRGTVQAGRVVKDYEVRPPTRSDGEDA